MDVDLTIFVISLYIRGRKPTERIMNIFWTLLTTTVFHMPNYEHTRVLLTAPGFIQSRAFNCNPSLRVFLAHDILESGNLQLVKLGEELFTNFYTGGLWIHRFERMDLEYIKYIIPKYLTADHRSNCSIRRASEHGKLDVIKYLLTFPGVDAAARNNEPLRVASAHGHYDVVKFLLTVPGVNPADQDNAAIKAAIKNGYVDIVRLLDPVTGYIDGHSLH
jgi:hypothetical protein